MPSFQLLLIAILLVISCHGNGSFQLGTLLPTKHCATINCYCIVTKSIQTLLGAYLMISVENVIHVQRMEASVIQVRRPRLHMLRPPSSSPEQ